jgi:RimJ/RimL family protein N-acetyltransferase
MTIRGFGIELVRLTEGHIEMLRQWRNDSRISRHMDFRGHITPEQQQRWFASLDPGRDFYFLIGTDGGFHGLIHFSSIDWEKGIGQSGLFIRSEEFQGTHLPVCASALLLEYFFSEKKLHTLEAKVMLGNDAALAYNLGLGFVEVESEQPDRFKRLRLTKAGFYGKFGKGLDALRRIHGAGFIVSD